MSLTVRIVAPTGRDAELIAKLLRRNQIVAEVCEPAELIRLPETALLGPLLIAEEALAPELLDSLGRRVSAQPPWSDLPILVLTDARRVTLRGKGDKGDRHDLGSPVLLERPIRPATLVSSVQAALRARMRQYEIRDAVGELRAERETLAVMLENLPVGVILAKPNGKVVTANTRVQALLRQPVAAGADMYAYPNWPAFRADGTRLRDEEFPLTRAMHEGRQVAPEDLLYERGDGTMAWINVAASPVFDPAGQVAGGVVTIADVDQQKRSETALIQNEKLAAVGRLAASISHEINNPLEAVTNLLYLARHLETLPAEAKDYIEAADQELARVSQIVSHTLQFHRQSTKARAVTAEDLLAPTLGLFSGRLANSGIALTVRHRGRDSITCFEGEIRQVLNNLVGNALDSMRSGGHLLIQTSDTRCWRTGTRGARISVADNGSGMAPEVSKRIFDAFYTTKGIKGTGLGLWISRGIAEKHRGSLRFKTRPGASRSGTVFSLFLCNEPEFEPVQP